MGNTCPDSKQGTRPTSLLCFECVALHQCVNELADGELFALGRTDHFVCEVFIREAERATQSVFDQVFGEAAGEVFFAFEDQVA